VRILAVGDSYMPTGYFRRAFAPLEGRHEIAYLQVDREREFVPASESELGLREYQGDPAEIAGAMAGVEVLVVQGAPVTDVVLDASDRLRLVCCARGGPVNVDMRAVTARRLPLVTTPGKNAEAVADLTIAFIVMLARRLPEAQGFLADGGQLKDNWEGARFMGRDLRGLVLGLVGFGQVGQRVAVRALAFGMDVLVYDPYCEAPVPPPLIHEAQLDDMLGCADVVSLHARASSENSELFGPANLAKMRPGAVLVNTARETLVDETALDEALRSGHLGGAALDVVHSSPPGLPHPLLRHANVIVTPHVGGATEETLLQGAEMIAQEIGRLESGEPLLNVANREAVEQ